MASAQAVQNAKRLNEASAEAVSRALDRFVARANISAFVIVKKYGADLMRRIVNLSPVDTGRFRAAWTAAARLVGVSVKSAPNPVAGALGALEGGGSLTRTADRVEFTARNSVRYAGLVEAGVSRQSSPGLVSNSLRQLETRILQELRQLPAEAAK